MNANPSTTRAEEPVHPRMMYGAPDRQGADALSPVCVAAGASATLPRAGCRATRRRWHLSTDQIAGVMALIEARRFELAVHAVRALPAATPELPALLGGLVWALAHAGELEATVDLVSEMLARFPLGPELVQTLVGLAEFVTSEQALTLVFEAVGVALRRTYGFQDAALFDWAQRIAYQFRRHGNAYASACILRTWRAPTFN